MSMTVGQNQVAALVENIRQASIQRRPELAASWRPAMAGEYVRSALAELGCQPDDPIFGLYRDWNGAPQIEMAVGGYFLGLDHVKARHATVGGPGLLFLSDMGSGGFRYLIDGERRGSVLLAPHPLEPVVVAGSLEQFLGRSLECWRSGVFDGEEPNFDQHDRIFYS